jgi:hypothetical protein
VDSLYGEARVTHENGRLRLQFGRGFAGPLEHWQYDAFRVRWEDRRLGSAIVHFRVGADGTVEALTVDAGPEVVLRRQEEG